MRMDQFMTAEQLGVRPALRSAVITVMGRLERQEYGSFRMVNPGTCAIARVVQEFAQVDGMAPFLTHENRGLYGIYMLAFTGENQGNMPNSAFSATQRDGAWLLRHWLTTGRCASPEEYCARRVDVEIRPEMVMEDVSW